MSSPSSFDQPYTWGRDPSTYLAPREIVRLAILRSRLEHRAQLRKRVIHPGSDTPAPSA